jgi:nucleoid-associated protein YgaU
LIPTTHDVVPFQFQQPFHRPDAGRLCHQGAGSRDRAQPRGRRAGRGRRTAAGGAPGHYIVKPGDTLIRIALDHGQNYRDIAAWNGLENPNLIEVGQELRVVRPNPPR